MKNTTDATLKDLYQQLEKAQEESTLAYRKVSGLEDKIAERRLEIFKESKILNKIGWILKLNEKKNKLYLLPDDEKERNWVDQFNKVTPDDGYHYRIDLGNCYVVVNDYEVEISFPDKVDPVSAIKELGLKIIKNQVSEKKKEIEENLKRLSDLEKYLEEINS